MTVPSTGSEPAVRLDKWLWAARFFKTRALASEAIDGGKVHLNGQRVKPSRHLIVGNRLAIRVGAELFEVEVLALSGQRLPASAA
ncbi:MAG TPA: RNA-binding protein, partial [Desulfobulbaceae bacterium]|nr:RNA-binding protein [Desulfobulbaceae bacterium]